MSIDHCASSSVGSYWNYLMSDWSRIAHGQTCVLKNGELFKSTLLLTFYTEHYHTHGYCYVYVVCMLWCSHVNYKVKCSCGVLCEANHCLTLWRAGRVRSRSDTAPGVAACPLALELRGTTCPFRLLTWHWKTRWRGKTNKPNSHEMQKHQTSHLWWGGNMILITGHWQIQGS